MGKYWLGNIRIDNHCIIILTLWHNLIYLKCFQEIKKMIEFAKYLKLKSLRNSIVLFGILVLSFKAHDLKGDIWPKIFISLGIFIWVYLYLSINKKVSLLKSGLEDSGCTFESKIKLLKQVEGIITVVLIICLFANLRGWWNGKIFIILPLTIYLLWYIYSYSLVYTFLKQNRIESDKF